MIVKVEAAGTSLCGRELYLVVLEELSLWISQTFLGQLVTVEGFWACGRENGVGGLLKFL